jgi:hypothetical protein
LGTRPSIPTLNLAARGGDNIAQPVGAEHTIDKTVGLAIGKTDLNAIHKTIGTKTAFLLVVEEFTNVKVIAQAVRKESKSASKLLLSKVGKTLMGRLSYIRHKNKQESSFSANGFVNASSSSELSSFVLGFIMVTVRVFSAVSVLGLNPKVSAKVALILTR